MYCTSLYTSYSPLLSRATGSTPLKTDASCHFSPRMSLNQNPQPPSSKSLLTTVANVIWGSSLPPGLLISTVRTAWSTGWHLMMSQLAPSDSSGGYSRPASKFRLHSSQFSRQSPATLHLYVGLPCPWAHRSLIVRALKGLEDAIPVSVAAPGQDGLWVFQNTRTTDPDMINSGKDNANGCRTLKEVYRLRKGGYDGRATVPMLWDVEKREVVCNESYDIIEFLNSGLNGVARNPGLDLSPVSLKGKIDEWNQVVYPNINNGVYRCGFAQTQAAYDNAVNDLFRALDKVDDHLSTSRYLCGETLTLADVCLFTTLIRFDLVYNVLFKCTKRKLLEYHNLHGYMRDIYQIPNIRGTCNFSAIADGYYRELFPLNPGGICPAMPSECEPEVLSRPHNREKLASVDKNMELQVS